MEQWTSSKWGKEYLKAVYYFFCLLNFYTKYITWNAGLSESGTVIKIVRHINDLRYADDTTLMAESEEELKSLLLRVKKEIEKAGLKLKIHKWLTYFVLFS